MESSVRFSRAGFAFPTPSAALGVPPLPSEPGLVRALRLLGMVPRESRMYLALVRVPLGAREASALVGLHRATGYRMLVRLIDRGMVRGNGRTPQLFEAVPPQILFQRLERAYRDEAEIATLMSESIVGVPDARTMSPSSVSGPAERTRFLCGEGLPNHPALAKLAEARNSAAIVVPPLSIPVPYRLALAGTIGRIARQGVNIRLILDATPADYRFALALLRESRGSTSSLQARHFAPLATHVYVIDRRRVVRFPVLGASNRHSPVGILLEDPSLVRAQVSRFESLWSEASGELLPPRRTRAYVG